MALGPKPWTWLNRRLGVNKPGTDWFNAVTTALWTLDIMFSDSANEASIQRPNADGSFWKIILPRLWGEMQGVDDKSIEINSSGNKLQLLNFDSPSSTPITADDYIPYSDTATGLLKYIQVSALLGDVDIDNKSISKNGTELQLHDFSLAATEDPIAADLFPYKDAADGVIHYVSWEKIIGAAGALVDNASTKINSANLIEVFGYQGATNTTPVSGDFFPFKDIDGGTINWVDRDNLQAAIGGPFWVLGGTAAYCYGEEIGNDAQTKVIDLDTQTLTNGTWAVDDTTHADDEDGALEVAGGGYFAAGVYADRGTADQAGYFADGSDTDVTLCGAIGVAKWAGIFNRVNVYARLGGYFAAGAFCDGVNTINLGDSTYAANATVGGINANATSGFLVGGTKVVGARAAAVADATDADDVVAQLNDLLAKLRTHGMIAT